VHLTNTHIYSVILKILQAFKFQGQNKGKAPGILGSDEVLCPENESADLILKHRVAQHSTNLPLLPVTTNNLQCAA
jgi:hypothetical protein